MALLSPAALTCKLCPMTAFSPDGPPSFLCANILAHAPRDCYVYTAVTLSNLPLQMRFPFYLPLPAGILLARLAATWLISESPLEPSTPLGSQRTKLCLHRTTESRHNALAE